MVDIVLGLAAAIVKAGVTIWLKDDTFAGRLGDSVADLVAEKVTGDLDQRRARRFFEDLEIPVAKRLTAVGTTAFGGLPDNERTAAILAAAGTFGRARLAAGDLFTRDLDPLFLERHIRSGNLAATRDLSDAATALYDRLLADGCAYVIEIADKLPHFQTGAFTELLQRDRQILDRLDEVLDRIPARAAGQSEEARFVTACRRHIATRLDRLELFGLDFESHWSQLSIAYVSLRADQPGAAGGQAIEDRLAATTRTMLVGRAGSGKTTVLQWLAVSAARSSFTGVLVGLNGHFPFYIRLRDFVGRKLPMPEQFLASSAPLLIPEAPDGWARAQLDSGLAMVLVDGVDELPPAERAGVADWLGELVLRFPRASYVITARPTAIADGWLAELGFDRSFLEPMSPSLVQTFVHNWHEATRQQAADADERERLDGYERSLLAEITKDRFLRDLADTPLLAGLLCALNRYLRSSLPRRRAEIYERALAMFDQRDRARGIAAGGVQVDLSAKNHLLGGLALWMIRNGESEIDLGTAIAQVGQAQVALPAAGDPAAVFRYLLERSGLLREPASDRVDFVHRTFQEYLAAQTAIDGNAVGELVSNAGNDQWGEVVVLAAGQANQSQGAQLLRGLLRRNWRGQQQYARQAMAVACLNEFRSLDPDLRREVESIIPGLLPPGSMERAEQLTAVGEPLIPLLAGRFPHWPGRALESIRAASLIGGPAALDLIRTISADLAIGDAENRAELSRAWQYFDMEDYAASVLAPLVPEVVLINSARYLPALRFLPSVERLEFRCTDDPAAPLAPGTLAPGIRTLTISGFVASALRSLAQFSLPGIKELEITSYRASDLSSLAAMPDLTGLRTLTIIFAPELTSLAGIARLQPIAELLIYGASQLTNVQELSGLPNLADIVLHEAVALDFQGYRPARERQSITLISCGSVDLAPLAGIEGLTIHADKHTSLYRTDLLGAGSAVAAIDIGTRRWPFGYI
jgi:hypothetical protein